MADADVSGSREMNYTLVIIKSAPAGNMRLVATNAVSAS